MVQMKGSNDLTWSQVCQRMSMREMMQSDAPRGP